MKRFTWTCLGTVLVAWAGLELPLEQMQHLLACTKDMGSENLLEMFVLFVLLRLRTERTRQNGAKQPAARVSKASAAQVKTALLAFVEEGDPPPVEPDQGNTPPQQIAFVEEGDPPPVEPDQANTLPLWLAFVEEGDPPPVEPDQGSTPPLMA